MKKRNSKIGGQAVLEGVMMRGTSAVATAVRDPEGKIQVESERIVPLKERSVAYRIPVLRGVISFVVSMISGFKVLSRSSEVYVGEEEEPGKFEKWLSEKLHVDVMSIATAIGMILGVVLAVGLFILAPNALTDLIYRFIPIEKIPSALGQNIVRNLTSGLIRIAIFVGYIALTSLMKDIKRLYRYHGAEHKVISCYEHGLDMTLENARTMSTIHDRCGTTFMVLVMIISIIFFSFFGWQTLWLRVLIRLAGIPIVAGISYEILQFMAKFDNPLVRILKAPGLALQKLTTKEPDDEMLEVSLTAFLTVQELEENPATETTKFRTFRSMEKVKKELKGQLTEGEDDWILMAVLGLKNRTELQECKKVTEDEWKKIQSAVARRKEGMPLQYATCSAPFYGYDFYVDRRVLIPRMDTEHLAEKAISVIKAKGEGVKALEICTGSGAVAVTVKLETDCRMTASDIDNDALTVAKKNAEKYGAEVEFIQSDLFENCLGQYDVILANPPYIPTADIEGLQKVVKNYEPRKALDGGADGLDFYKRIFENVVPKLNDNGTLIMEVGIGQGETVNAMFGGKGEEIYDYNTPKVLRCLAFQKEDICLKD